MRNDIHDFVKGSPQCVITRTGELRPSSPGTTLHGGKPNEIVNFYFPLYVRKRVAGAVFSVTTG